jgi:hypothetical protein
MQCNHPNCKAQAMRNGSGLCFVHCDLPEIVAARNEARSRGGKAQRKRDAVQEAITQAQDAMRQLAAGTLKVDKAKMIARLAELVIYGSESSELKARLNALKQR